MNTHHQHLIVHPSSISGIMVIPTSKSQTLRAILLGSLSTGVSHIEKILDSPDTHAMIQACRSLGAKITREDHVLTIHGVGGVVGGVEDVIDAGNSGLVLRFLCGIAALGRLPIVITGDYSIRHNRFMGDLLHGLRQWGVSAESTRDDDHAPVIIKGPISAYNTQIEGRDSQPVSALLFTAAFSEGTHEIIVNDPGEIPWVDLTLDWLDRLGVSYINESYRKYIVNGKKTIEGFRYRVPGDLSSCSFPVAAALVTKATMTIENVDWRDKQGDKRLFEVLQKMGADITVDSEAKRLVVRGGVPLKGMKIDVNDFIDAIVILGVIGCFAEGETIIYNGGVARQKECDRISAVVMELQKMGADIEEKSDGFVVRKSTLHSAKVWSHHDHRIAMALAIAGMGAHGETIVQEVSCITKTYPTFVEDFILAGAKLETVS